MVKKVDWENVAMTIVWILVVAGVFAAVAWMNQYAEQGEKACSDLSNDLGLPTRYAHGICYVEVCHQWIKAEKIILGDVNLKMCDNEGTEVK